MKKEEWFREYNRNYVNYSTDRYYEIQARKERNAEQAPKSAIKFEQKHGAALRAFEALSITDMLKLPVSDPRIQACEARYQKQQFIERRALVRDADYDRLENGFQWAGGFYGGDDCRSGYYRPAFKELGLRTETYPEAERAILRKFVQGTERRGRIESSNYKSEVYAQPSKLQALDMAQVLFNREMRSIIRVDLDGVFPSEWELKQDILKCGTKLPVAVTYQKDPLNPLLVSNPHLYWIINDAVCFTEKGRIAPQKLFSGAIRAITHALTPIGADLGGLSSPNRGKNPISPLWHTSVWKTEPYVLSNEGLAPEHRRFEALTDGLDLTVSEEQVEIAVVQQIAGQHVQTTAGQRTSSNKVFNQLRKAALAWAWENHPDADGSGTIEQLEQHLWRISDLDSQKERHVALIRMISRYAFEHFDHAKIPARLRKVNRFACADELTETMTLAERQAVGAHHTAQAKVAATQDAIRAAVLELQNQGIFPTSKAVAASSGIPLRTVQRHLKAVIIPAPLGIQIYSEIPGNPTGKEEPKEGEMDSDKENEPHIGVSNQNEITSAPNGIQIYSKNTMQAEKNDVEIDGGLKNYIREEKDPTQEASNQNIRPIPKVPEFLRGKSLTTQQRLVQYSRERDMKRRLAG